MECWLGMSDSITNYRWTICFCLRRTDSKMSSPGLQSRPTVNYKQSVLNLYVRKCLTTNNGCRHSLSLICSNYTVTQNLLVLLFYQCTIDYEHCNREQKTVIHYKSKRVYKYQTNRLPFEWFASFHCEYVSFSYVIKTCHAAEIFCCLELIVGATAWRLTIDEWSKLSQNSKELLLTVDRPSRWSAGGFKVPLDGDALYVISQTIVLQVWWPNQQRQSTKGGWWLAISLTRLTSPCYNNACATSQ